MARQTVEISFWPNEGCAPGRQPDLNGVGDLVSQTYPSSVLFEAFMSPEAGMTCVLDVAFNSPATPDPARSADAFKRAIVRLEGEAGFQALWRTDGRVERPEFTYLQARVQDARLPSGKPLAFRLPMALVAKTLIDQAHVHGAAFSYRVELLRRGPQPDRVRPLIPALAELQQRGPRMSGLADSLLEVLDLARREGWHAKESFGVAASDQGVRQWLEEAVVQNTIETTPFLSRDLIELAWLVAGDARVAPSDLDNFALGLRSRDYSETAIDSASKEVRQEFSIAPTRSSALVLRGAAGNGQALYIHQLRSQE